MNYKKRIADFLNIFGFLATLATSANAEQFDDKYRKISNSVIENYSTVALYFGQYDAIFARCQSSNIELNIFGLLNRPFVNTSTSIKLFESYRAGYNHFIGARLDCFINTEIRLREINQLKDFHLQLADKFLNESMEELCEINPDAIFTNVVAPSLVKRFGNKLLYGTWRCNN